MKSIRRRLAVPMVGLAVLAGVSALAPSSASALTPCASGWSVPNSLVSTHITTWCYKQNQYGAPTWIIKVPSQYVHNVSSPTSTPSSGNPNPAFTTRSVHDWLASDASASVMINGTYFNDTSGNATTTMSFPLWNNSGSLQATGNYPPSDPGWPGIQNTRVCVGWSQVSSSASAPAWTYNNNDWNGVLSNASSQCGSYNTRSVALSPNYDFGTTGAARTFIGWDSASAKLCLLVSKEVNNTAVRAALTTYSCAPIAQMDGGNSTQLAVRNDASGGIIDYWSGDGGDSYRRVPHAIKVDD